MINAVKKSASQKNYLIAIGRRKTAVARIKFIKNSTGQSISINGQEYQKYFSQAVRQEVILESLKATSTTNYNISVLVKGGGSRSQAEAIRLGLARVLEKTNKEFRSQLKPLGLLKRDPRVKERKKYGLKRARRAPQWQKR